MPDVRTRCPLCGGTGVKRASAWPESATCPRCEGKGYVVHLIADEEWNDEDYDGYPPDWGEYTALTDLKTGVIVVFGPDAHVTWFYVRTSVRRGSYVRQWPDGTVSMTMDPQEAFGVALVKTRQGDQCPVIQSMSGNVPRAKRYIPAMKNFAPTIESEEHSGSFT